MTQDQLDRLCEVDPAHFMRVEDIPEAVFVWLPGMPGVAASCTIAMFREGGEPWDKQDSTTRMYTCLWWMLDSLPAANMDFALVGKRLQSEYVVAPDIEDGPYYKGVGETLAEAVVEAYIEFRERAKA
jgi:hypothetical protein